MQRTKNWIRAYYSGTRFAHSEAYFLCAVGNTRPDFALHPENDHYVLSFDSVNSTLGSTKAHKDFEKFVDDNRQEISLNAAGRLDIDWEEIENYNSK